MNELNLQNPEFRNYIHQVIYDFRRTTVLIVLNNPKVLLKGRIYSKNKPFEDYQRWFTLNGHEIRAIKELTNE
jgi:hypothetical protein